MKVKTVVGIAKIGLSILGLWAPLVYAENSGRHAGQSDDIGLNKEDSAHHLRIIAALRGNDQVVPWKPPVHPVTAVYNREAIIPPMCYTKTEGKHNPCYVCHQNPIAGRENTMADADLQLAYSFSDKGMANHWDNLFEDRGDRVAAISDDTIMEWIAQDNYSELPARLREAKFQGWIPDLKNLQLANEAFDAQGFAKDGSLWVAYNYKPFPSTFWPTNGSTGDAMIRLGAEYRNDQAGNYSVDVYRANLAVVEANIKGLKQIATLPIDESKLGVDLNGDNQLSVVERITKVDKYLGAAADHFLQSGTYPVGTEFLHTVRYLGLTEGGAVGLSKRLKEVRYIKKWVNYPLVSLTNYYREEGYAKDEGYLPGYVNLRDKGLDNGMGWSVQGFIEDRKGRLRAYTYEENLACMGCHNSIGATIDKTFSFPRKVDGPSGWKYIDLRGMADVPNRGEQQGEYLTYFQRVGGGSEFRNNPEIKARWFDGEGKVAREKVAKADIYELITPSRERALTLNKAYRVIVEDQDFIFGRDATVTAPTNVHREIDNKTAETLPPELFFNWDLRLNWDDSQAAKRGH